MIAPLILLGLAGILFTVAMGKTTSPTPPSGSGSGARPSGNYSPESWMPYLTPLLAKLNIPLIFAINWIRLESGGNPCAFGTARAKGPDGNPLEQGIGQLYNPDDFVALKVPLGSLRTYCIPGTQACSRPLTEDEMYAQARALVGLIGRCTARAARVLGDNAAAALPGWDSRRPDFWRLVKLVHALPGLVGGFGNVRAALGRPPTGWDEFRDSIMKSVKLDSGTERYRSDFPRLFANAERCSSGVGVGR